MTELFANGWPLAVLVTIVALMIGAFVRHRRRSQAKADLFLGLRDETVRIAVERITGPGSARVYDLEAKYAA